MTPKSEIPKASPIRPLARRQSVGAGIAAQLQELILAGTFKPGERLPGQRELAQQFGASMAGVREAISVLSAAGLVEARPGRGTVVQSAAASASAFDGWLGVAADRQELGELIEARQLLEAFTLRRTLEGVTPEHLTQLRAAVQTMRDCLHDPPQYVQADMDFHLLIAQLAGNRIIIRLMKAIQRPLLFQLNHSIDYLARTGQLENNLLHHQRILEGIERQDLSAAQRAYADMLESALQFEMLL